MMTRRDSFGWTHAFALRRVIPIWANDPSPGWFRLHFGEAAAVAAKL